MNALIDNYATAAQNYKLQLQARNESSSWNAYQDALIKIKECVLRSWPDSTLQTSFLPVLDDENPSKMTRILSKIGSGYNPNNFKILRVKCDGDYVTTIGDNKVVTSRIPESAGIYEVKMKYPNGHASFFPNIQIIGAGEMRIVPISAIKLTVSKSKHLRFVGSTN